MSNPVDDYLEISVEKNAAQLGLNFPGHGYGARVLGGIGRIDPERVGNLVGMVGLVGGSALLISAAKAAQLAVTKSSDYKKMLEVNPDLAEHQANDPKMFNQHYSSLRSLNPRFAKDPVVAGAYMRRMSEFPSNAGPILVESLKDQRSDTGLKDFATMVGTTAKVLDA